MSRHTKADRRASRRAHDRWHASVAGPSAILGARGLRAFLFAPLSSLSLRGLPCACDEWGPGHLDGCPNATPDTPCPR